MKKKIFIAAAVIISSTAQAQEKDSTKLLNELVITATKFPIKQSLTGKVVSIITREQLEQNNGKSLAEILNVQAGLIVNGSSNTLGTNQDLYLRGASAGKTLVLLDGIPVYDVAGISGAFDLNLIAVEQVERVEILKGSQSTLYGSDAVAGVINIITKKGGAKKLTGNINLATGSYGTFKETIGINGTINKTSYNIQLTQLNSKGFSSAKDVTHNKNFDKDGINESAFRANITQKIADKILIRFLSQVSKYKTDLDASQFTDDADYTATTKNSIAGIGADFTIGKNKLHINYNYNQTQRIYLDDSTSVGGFAKYSRGEYNGSAHFTEAYSNVFVAKKIDLLLGVDYRNQGTSQNYVSLSMYGPFTTALGDSAKVNQLGIYASFMLKDMQGFNLELGGRYNHFNKYGDAFTFSFNPSYVINNTFKFFGNITTGFKAPSLYQVYSEYRNPIAELKPEQSLSIEGGMQYNNKSINLRAVYFLRNIKDVITFYSTGAPTYASYYVNADKQKDKGLELEAAFTYKKIKLTANYTNLDGFIETKRGLKDTSFFNLYRRPKQTFNVNIGISASKKLNLNAGIQAISKRYEAVYAAPSIVMAAYYTLNLYASYQCCTKAKLFCDFKNSTNQKYTELRGYNSRGCNVMAGVTVNL
ncbi:MAG: TonB-dependent receptor [Ferruginibacter sp.]